jgi:hypothetical protein
MKALLMVVAVLVALVAVPAVADDGQVSQQALRAVGLGGMQVVSDAYGSQVRGRTSGFVKVVGTSLIFGQLLTPDTKNFVVGSSVNEVDANGETTNTGILSATKDHGVALQLALAVTFPDTSTYSGAIIGVAAGTGSVSVNLP